MAYDVSKHDDIRQKIREIGRLLLQGKRNGKLKGTVDFVMPGNFPHVIEAVRKIRKQMHSEYHQWR